jgi:hypothetical protein
LRNMSVLTGVETSLKQRPLPSACPHGMHSALCSARTSAKIRRFK